MTFNDTEEYSLRSIAILGCNICSKITVAHVTLPKAVLSTVIIFAVYTGCNETQKMQLKDVTFLVLLDLGS